MKLRFPSIIGPCDILLLLLFNFSELQKLLLVFRRLPRGFSPLVDIIVNLLDGFPLILHQFIKLTLQVVDLRPHLSWDSLQLHALLFKAFRFIFVLLGQRHNRRYNFVLRESFDEFLLVLHFHSGPLSIFLDGGEQRSVHLWEFDLVVFDSVPELVSFFFNLLKFLLSLWALRLYRLHWRIKIKPLLGVLHNLLVFGHLEVLWQHHEGGLWDYHPLLIWLVYKQAIVLIKAPSKDLAILIDSERLELSSIYLNYVFKFSNFSRSVLNWGIIMIVRVSKLTFIICAPRPNSPFRIKS